MKRWLGLLGLAFAASAGAADDAALRAVDACAAKLDQAVEVGIENVARRCPDLLPALERAAWRDLLPAQMRARREELSASSLRALAKLVRESRALPPQNSVPRTATLAPVLLELGEKGGEGATRWERFKRWLQKKFERRPDEHGLGLVDRWLQSWHTSEGVAQAITYLGYAVVMALAMYVIWSELRAAGLLVRARRAALGKNPDGEWRGRLTLADALQAPLVERAGLLLRLLGEALTRAQRLPAAQGMSAIAIARRARLDDEADRAQLAAVAAVTEQVRFAVAPPPAAALEAAVASARVLLGKYARLPAEKG